MTQQKPDWFIVLVSYWHTPALLKYLNLYDIARLDSAICNHEWRNEWLTFIQKNISLNQPKEVIWTDRIIDWCAVLKNIKFEDTCFNFHKNQDGGLSGSKLISLAKLCPNLKTINAHQKIRNLNDRLVAEHRNLYFIPSIAPKLENLGIFYYTFTDDDLVIIGNSSQQLISIKLYAPWDITSAATSLGLRGLLKNNRKLIHFETNISSPEILSYIGSYCPLIETIRLESDIEISHPYIKAFTEACTSLKSLFIQNYSLDNNNAVNQLLSCLGENNPNLEEFVLQSRTNRENTVICDEALKTFAIGCSNLHTFSIDHIQVTFKGIRYLVNNCPLLQDIGLFRSDICPSIIETNNVLHEIGKLKNLKKINISFCENVTDEGIECLLQENGRNLEDIEIVGCDSLTDQSLISVAFHCPSLESISLGLNSADMTSSGMFLLFHQCKKLHIVSHTHDSIVPVEVQEELKARHIRASATSAY